MAILGQGRVTQGPLAAGQMLTGDPNQVAGLGMPGAQLTGPAPMMASAPMAPMAPQLPHPAATPGINPNADMGRSMADMAAIEYIDQLRQSAAAPMVQPPKPTPFWHQVGNALTSSLTGGPSFQQALTAEQERERRDITAQNTAIERQREMELKAKFEEMKMWDSFSNRADARETQLLDLIEKAVPNVSSRMIVIAELDRKYGRALPYQSNASIARETQRIVSEKRLQIEKDVTEKELLELELLRARIGGAQSGGGGGSASPHGSPTQIIGSDGSPYWRQGMADGSQIILDVGGNRVTDPDILRTLSDPRYNPAVKQGVNEAGKFGSFLGDSAADIMAEVDTSFKSAMSMDGILLTARRAVENMAVTGPFAGVANWAVQMLDGTFGVKVEGFDPSDYGDYDWALNNLVLNARGALKGQGAISDFETRILRNAQLNGKVSRTAALSIIELLRAKVKLSIEMKQRFDAHIRTEGITPESMRQFSTDWDEYLITEWLKSEEAISIERMSNDGASQTGSAGTAQPTQTGPLGFDIQQGETWERYYNRVLDEMIADGIPEPDAETRAQELTRQNFSSRQDSSRGESRTLASSGPQGGGSSNRPFTGNGFGTYSQAVAQIESSGRYDAVNKTYGNLGKYQFGAPALVDLGYVKRGTKTDQLNNPAVWTGKNGITSQDRFLQDTAIQEISFEIYTQNNRKALERMGLITTNTPEVEVWALLGGAHLSGPGGVREWARGGQNREDGHGTSVEEYYNKIKNSF